MIFPEGARPARDAPDSEKPTLENICEAATRGWKGGFNLKNPDCVCERRELADLAGDARSILWHGIPPIFLRETVTGAPPLQRTMVKTAWDATELRILFQAEDDHPWATLTARDAPLFEEEVVEVFLDPVGDLECYFEIEVNPLNAVLDLVLRKNRSGYLKNFAWRCDGLRTAVVRTADGWNAELSIPFCSLAAESPRPGDVWRVNFLRIDRPLGAARELSAWSPTALANFHVPERFGTLRFAV